MTHEIATNIAEKVKKALAKAKAEGKKIKYKPLEAAGVPKSKRFSTEVQERFILSCTRNGGTTSSCECLLGKFELSKVSEQGQAIAELFFMETEVKQHIPLPSRIQQRIEQCHATAV